MESSKIDNLYSCCLRSGYFTPFDIFFAHETLIYIGYVSSINIMLLLPFLCATITSKVSKVFLKKGKCLLIAFWRKLFSVFQIAGSFKTWAALPTMMKWVVFPCKYEYTANWAQCHFLGNAECVTAIGLIPNFLANWLHWYKKEFWKTFEWEKKHKYIISCKHMFSFFKAAI